MELLKLIGNFLEEENKKRKSSSKASLKPSSIGYKCLRKLYYDYYKVEPDRGLTSKEIIIFKTGSTLHEMLQDMLLKAGLLIQYIDSKGREDIEFAVEDEELKIKKGKIDGVLVIDKKLYLLEIKTINTKKFEALKGPQQDHVLQGELYRYLFLKCLEAGKYKHIKALEGYTEVEGLIYLYLCKENGEMKEYTTVYSLDTLNTLLDKAAYFLYAYAIPVELPPKCKSRECYFCTFRNKCEKDYNIKEKL